MHPTILATLAEQRHADLLRYAEDRRRLGPRGARRRSWLPSRPIVGPVSRLTARLSQLGTTRQPTTPVACCA